MITRLFISTILVSALCSCGNKRTPDKPQQEVPKALEGNNKSASFEIVSKRGYDDMVQSLYDELVSKNVDLKKLEDKISELGKSRGDSTDSFDEFNKKNQSWFSAADAHIAVIGDSVLRDKMKSLIANNLAKYNASIARHNEFLKIIEAKNLTIADLHNILKIVKTLPLIEKYQHDNLPGVKPLEGYITQQDETIKLTDTLTKK